MPYLPGYPLVDDSDVQLADDSDVPYTEEDTDLTWLSATLPAQGTEVLTRIGEPQSPTIFGDLAAIISALGTITALIEGASTLGDAIRAFLGIPAGGYPGLIPRVEALYAALVDPATVLTAIQNVRQDLAEPHLPTLEDVLDVLATGVPATELPDPAPSGYGGIQPGDLGGELLGDLRLADGTIQHLHVNDALFDVVSHARLIAAQHGYPDSRNPDFALVVRDAQEAWVNLRYEWASQAFPPPPLIDWTQWDGSETLVALLNRSQEAYTFAYLGPGDEGASLEAFASIHGSWYGWRCRVLDRDLPLVSGRLYAATLAVPLAAPIWPGLANVTLGTPVEITDDIRLEGPMDGILVEITDTEPGSGKIPIGAQNFWYREGFVSFEADNGAVERVDWLRGTLGVYAPQSMVQAAACVVHLDRASAATVTPWTRNA